MRVFSLVLLLVTTASSVGLAQQSPPVDFSPLAFLVGSCWIGTFPDGKQTDEHCFEWVYDKKFIRDRHVVRGGQPYQGETLYGWDPREKQLSFWYFNSDGQVIRGEVENTQEGLVFPERITTPEGEVELKSVWTRQGENGYRVWQGQRTGETWKTLWTMEFKRTS